jgi:hypothetical protein
MTSCQGKTPGESASTQAPRGPHVPPRAAMHIAVSVQGVPARP